MNVTQCAHTYAFHGLRLRVSSDPVVADAVHARLAQFPVAGDGDADLSFDFACARGPDDCPIEQPSGPTRSIYESTMGDVLYADETDQIWIDCANGVRALCDPKRGHTRVSIPWSQAAQSWLISHPLLTLPLIEMLKRRQHYSVHAAGISLRGKGLLIPGTSGAGKSTLTLALLRAGFSFLGDDMLFLTRAEDGLRALAFPDEIDVTDETVRLFPELEDLRDAPTMHGWPKHQIRAPRRFGVDVAWTCRPAALVFPHVARMSRSVLEPMDRMEALLELAPNVLLTAPDASQAHLDALADLVETCACYRLKTGTDFDRLPGLLAELIS